VQLGVDDLDRRDTHLWMYVDRHAAPVVRYRDRVVRLYGDCDVPAEMIEAIVPNMLIRL
jgi:hypothetical protein